MMTKADMTDAILAAKAKKGVGWEAIAEHLEMNDVWVASACLGQSSMPPEYSERLCQLLELPDGVARALAVYPVKGTDEVVPTDPLIYRFYEIMQVYGLSLKEVIQEKFGDGIMSAIDFTLSVDREEDPKGDRVVVTMSGKFLPYKRW